MGVQGVLSICVAGKVVSKVVVGCNAVGIRGLATVLRAATNTPEPMELSRLCRIHEVGCCDCLVILTPECTLLGATILTGEPPTGYERYRATFDDPRFNPRWPHGTADIVEVIDL
jgi:hypothetical protein